MTERGVVVDGGEVAVRDLEVGEPGPGEVRVALAASGVCHTDHDLATNVPVTMVLGHEGAGTVEAVGPDVRRVAVGDRVLLTWAIACGRCYQCDHGNQVHCETLGLSPRGHAALAATTCGGAPAFRAFNLGTLSTATVVKAEAVVKIGPDIPFTSACILGCGVMTGFGSVVNVARVAAGESVVVIGCGGVGLNAVQGARVSGASPIVAVDITQERLDQAVRFGATHTVLADRADEGLLAAAEEVKKIVGRRGADHAFECTAVPSLAFAPLVMTRMGGTAVQVSGVEQDVTVDMRLFEFDRVYVNPLYGRCRPDVDFPRLIRLYGDGRLLLDELVTQTYPLDDQQRAFDDLLAGVNAKGVVLLR